VQPPATIPLTKIKPTNRVFRTATVHVSE
jgi:hypothetical protein